jgi:putative ABC transport system ATP-binding protein
MDTVIALRGVEREYRMGRTTIRALRGVSAEFQRGEFTAIAGPSGSGKTTLLNLIGCIDKPDRGRVIVNGQDVTDTPLHRLAGLRNRYFGFIFQTFNLIPVLNAYENVEFPVLLDGLPSGERRARVEGLLERVGLEDHRRHRPHELSGGQRQRVAIARALVAQPLAVLADEPTANLDSHTGAGILDLMHELNEARGVTFLFSTHDPQIIRKARRVLAIHDGEVQEPHLRNAIAPAAARAAAEEPAETPFARSA